MLYCDVLVTTPSLTTWLASLLSPSPTESCFFSAFSSLFTTSVPLFSFLVGKSSPVRSHSQVCRKNCPSEEPLRFISLLRL